jgi:hypothetical protein
MADDPTSPDLKRFEPRSDPIFLYLLEEAWNGSIPVYAAEVPLKAVRRADPFWAPENSPDGIRAMKAVMAQIGAGRDFRPWVYPKKNKLIVSDSYFVLACFEMLKPETIRVWHLGIPAVELPAHGPLASTRVRELILQPPLVVKP